MKYARVRDNKIVKIDPVQFPNALPVNIEWSNPTEYPLSFYSVGAIQYTVNSNSVSENKDFTLIPLDELKSIEHKRLSNERWLLEEKGFDFNGSTILATTTAQLKMPEMPVSVNSFKISDGVFITMDNTQLLKDALVTHVQSCYEWEDIECKKISDCETHEELNELLK